MSEPRVPPTPQEKLAELLQGDGLYYVAQERAFAPGISGGTDAWPAVLTSPKVKHGRLVKRVLTDEDRAFLGAARGGSSPNTNSAAVSISLTLDRAIAVCEQERDQWEPRRGEHSYYEGLNVGASNCITRLNQLRGGGQAGEPIPDDLLAGGRLPCPDCGARNKCEHDKRRARSASASPTGGPAEPSEAAVRAAVNAEDGTIGMERARWMLRAAYAVDRAGPTPSEQDWIVAKDICDFGAEYDRGSAGAATGYLTEEFHQREMAHLHAGLLAQIESRGAATEAAQHADTAHRLAMLALQSERYQQEADYRDATDDVLSWALASARPPEPTEAATEIAILKVLLLMEQVAPPESAFARCAKSPIAQELSKHVVLRGSARPGVADPLREALDDLSSDGCVSRAIERYESRAPGMPHPSADGIKGILEPLWAALSVRAALSSGAKDKEET